MYRHNNQTSINIMSKYMAGSAFSIVALLSKLLTLIMIILDVNQSCIGLGGLLTKESSRTRTLSPLQHLKVLNYQPRSLSSSISPNSTLYVHSRHA